eukprot:scaffold2.g7101.t1
MADVAALPQGGRSSARLEARAPATAAGAAGTEAAAHTCRICWEEADAGDAAGGALLADTCRCSGSLRYVHARCLLDWQRHAANPHTCATCRGAIALPPGLARRVRLPPLWAEHLRDEASRFRATPALALLRWWNHLVVCAGLTYGVRAAHAAWHHAPALAWQLRARPLAVRWQVLSTAAFAATYARVWAPEPAVRGFGPWQPRWLRWHLLCYAAGLALDAHIPSALLRLAPAAGGAAASAAAAVASAAARFALGLGVALQVAALHHLSPAWAFARGYSDGISRAFAWTGLLLSRVLRLLPGGARVVSLAAAAAGLLPGFLHGLFRAAAVGVGM